MEFLIRVDIFEISFHKLKIFCQGRFQKLNLLNNWIFLLIYFQNKLPNQIKNSNDVKNVKSELDDLKKKWLEKELTRNLGGIIG